MHIIHSKNRTTDENLTQQSSKVKVDPRDKRLRDKNGNLCPPAVNTIYGCIQHYRAQAARQVSTGMPVTAAIKTIYINERMWNQFEYWYRSMLPETQADATVEMLTFFDVEIKKASKFAVKEMYWDFHPSKKIEA